MMKKLLWLTAPVAFILTMTGMRLDPTSAGAPVSSTGAPGEVNCTTSGCHDDGTPNTGTAQTFLKIEGNPQAYTPGQSYDVTVQIADADVVRFGYQLVALTGDGKNAGNFTVLDEERTQVIQNHLKLTDRQYATYTYDGTAALKTGESEWKIRWTAPETNAGDVQFYLATVSANDDNTDKGDRVYTMSREFAAPMISSVSAHEGSLDYVQVVSSEHNFIELAAKFSKPEVLKAEIVNVQGESVSLGEIEFSNSVGRYRIASPNLASGAYILRLHNSSRSLTQKLLIH
ncbi:MAG: choice-of-anchor V domain-containing protein [Bacteroidota bacterium]